MGQTKQSEVALIQFGEKRLGVQQIPGVEAFGDQP